MTKNSLNDLNDHLFAALERLGEEGISAETIETESKRATAIVDVADQIIEGQKLKITAAKLFAEHGERVLPMLPRIGPPASGAKAAEAIEHDKGEDKAE